ncbi:MAG: sensor histidine kinase [Ferruginibacter sp.]
MRVCLILILFLSACETENKNITNNEINDLYNAVNRNRYTNSDSLKIFTTLLEEKSKGSPPAYEAMALISKGIYYSRIASFNQSLQSYQKSLALLKKSGIDSLIAKSYTGIGNAYKNMSDYPPAIENLQIALNLYNKNNWKEGEAGVHSNIAQIYQQKEQLPEAKQHLQSALKILSNNKYTPAYLNTSHTLANVYGMNNQLDSALALDEEGILISDEMKSPIIKSTFLDNKANCFMYSNRPDSARIYFYQSLLIDSTSGNLKQMADTYLNLGTLASMQENSQLAENNFLKGLELSKKATYPMGVRSAWAYLGNLYKKNGDYKKALDAQVKNMAVKDSIVNEKTETRIAELKTIYDTEKKEKQIAIQSTQLSRQKFITVAIISIAFAVLFSGYAFYRRSQTKKENEMMNALYKQKQQATIHILTAEEKERQRIASDLHDGIGQMMTAAWLNLQALGKRMNTTATGTEEAVLLTKTTSLVGDSCAEIRQVSHNMMPNSLSKKGLINALREFTNQLDPKVLSVNLQTEEEKMDLDQNTEIILYRVLQECVNNVVRHAEATELDISIICEKDGIDVLVEDNGKGFDASKISASTGIGIQNIQSRIQYLNGTVEWDNTGNGTVVAIHIPYKND